LGSRRSYNLDFEAWRLFDATRFFRLRRVGQLIVIVPSSSMLICVPSLRSARMTNHLCRSSRIFRIDLRGGIGVETLERFCASHFAVRRLLWRAKSDCMIP
jgi:hypothetical protein